MSDIEKWYVGARMLWLMFVNLIMPGIGFIAGVYLGNFVREFCKAKKEFSTKPASQIDIPL